jgi:hypothetical protein
MVVAVVARTVPLYVPRRTDKAPPVEHETVICCADRFATESTEMFSVGSIVSDRKATPIIAVVPLMFEIVAVACP